MMIRLSLMLIFLGVITLLTGCGSGYPDSTKVPAKYMPKVNPHPKYFMTVKGFIDPRLQQRIHLTIVAEYNNYNPKCNLWISHFEGADSPWQIFRNFPVHPNKIGRYAIKIPLDYYQPGRCNWNTAGIRYQTKKSQGEDAPVLTFLINKNPETIQNVGSYSFTCSKKSCRGKSIGGFATKNQTVLDSQQLTFYLNFYYKERL